LQTLCGQYESALASVGLKPNPKKSATLRIRAHGKEKRWYCGNEPYVMLDNNVVGTISVEKTYRYLGTHATLGVYTPEVAQRLNDGLNNQTRAPLKPQQRIYMLRHHLIPSLLHQLVLEEKVTRKPLRNLNYAIRAAIRKWLRLAKDCPNSLFYAPESEGGLNLHEMLVCIPLLRRERMGRLMDTAVSGKDPVLGHLTTRTRYMRDEITKWSKVKAYSKEITTGRSCDIE
jgi:hypothetical protein